MTLLGCEKHVLILNVLFLSNFLMDLNLKLILEKGYSFCCCCEVDSIIWSLILHCSLDEEKKVSKKNFGPSSYLIILVGLLV